jgi:Zn-dependent peptidase ImmA (M78 family)/transcriptional regulator with XRE-family HTH domain
MNSIEPKLLDSVFGLGLGSTPAERARHSSRTFVRSIDQLAEYSSGARGRRLTAYEALEAYGFERLAEAVLEGSALLAASRDALGRVLHDRREQLALSTRRVAARANVDVSVVEAAEQSRRVSIRECERIARALGLDERFISVLAEPSGNERVAVRLRTLGRENQRMMTHAAVSAISEAAWVAMTQIRLEESLRLRPAPSGIEYSSNYGTIGHPAYKWGYLLAVDARKSLGLGRAPLDSLRALAEERLGLPVIQSELGESIAGVTVEVGDRRAIVVNLSGRNRHVYVRRNTIAHELGHILFDPPNRLNSLRVDEYEELEAPSEMLPDAVEQRANSFAAEFLAPQSEVVARYWSGIEDPVGTIMDEFGVSFTVARYQLWNGLDRAVPLEKLVSTRRQPPQEWEGREAFTVDYHPIRHIRPSRAGRFSALVVRAAQDSVISWDTAAEWLETNMEEVQGSADILRDLFPAVFR